VAIRRKVQGRAPGLAGPVGTPSAAAAKASEVGAVTPRHGLSQSSRLAADAKDVKITPEIFKLIYAQATKGLLILRPFALSYARLSSLYSEVWHALTPH
jgi:hypothetical protein